MTATTSLRGLARVARLAVVGAAVIVAVVSAAALAILLGRSLLASLFGGSAAPVDPDTLIVLAVFPIGLAATIARSRRPETKR